MVLDLVVKQEQGMAMIEYEITVTVRELTTE